MNSTPPSTERGANKTPRRNLPRHLPAVGIAIVLGLSLLFAFAPRFVRDLNTGSIDLVALALPETSPQPAIVVVEIDDPSLASYGQWPWPRTLMAQLVDAISIHGPAVIATNILFPEADRSSHLPRGAPPATISTSAASDSSTPKDHDLLFAEHLAAAPMILSYELLFDRLKDRQRPPCQPPAAIARPSLPSPYMTTFKTLYRASDILCNYPPLQQAATGAGFLNGGADEDGVLRRLPLLIDFEERVYPSLALATVMRLLGVASPSVVSDGLGGLVLRMADRSVKSDALSQLLLLPLPPGTLKRVSAQELLNGNIGSDTLRGKIVLLGCLAPGLQQSYPTPFASSTSLIDLHAAAIATLLAQLQPYRPHSLLLIEVAAALLLTLVILASTRRSPCLTIFLALGLVGAIWLGVMLLARESGLLFSPLLPSLTLLVNATLFVTVTLLHQQREAQTLLKANKHQLRSIIHTIPDIIFRLDPEGMITFISPAISRYGRKPEDLLGRPIVCVIHPADRDKATHRITERRTGLRATVDMELRLLLEKGEGPEGEETRFFSVSAEGLYHDGQPGGSFLGTQGIARDISEKKRLERQLLQAQKMEAIGNLAAGIAHDLNNTLTGLVSYPDLLLLEIPPDSPLYAKIVSLRNSGKKAAAMVQDLLSLARRKVPAIDLVDINVVIEEYLRSPEFHDLQHHHPAVTVSPRLEARKALVKGSTLQLIKMVMNLLHNAMEASAAGGHVVVATDDIDLSEAENGYERIAAGSYVRITVADNGRGIAAGDLAHIFEPFFTRKQAGRSGTGLGMTIVWSVVKDHLGFLDLTSAEGRGTTFHVYLPKA